MLPYQERLLTEKKELSDKIMKLENFLNNEIFKTLPFDEQSRMIGQLWFMKAYYSVLAERVSIFEKT